VSRDAENRLHLGQWDERSGLRWQDYIWCRDLSVKLCRYCRGSLSGPHRVYCSKLCRQAFNENHFWGDASRAAGKRAGYRCEECGGGRGRLEIHHLVAVDGVTDFRSHSCYNHQANLRVLCVTCHARTRWGPARYERETAAILQGVLL